MTKLITALQSVIAALENGSTGYSWKDPESCNCGVVAQALTGYTPYGLKDTYLVRHCNTLINKEISPTWTNLVKEYCPITGTPVIEIFKIFYEAGFTKEDIVNLEYLSDKKILERAKIKTGFFRKKYYTKKENLIKYLRAWVEILCESKSKEYKEQFREKLMQAQLLYKDIIEQHPPAPQPSKHQLKEKIKEAILSENYELATKYKKQLEG